MSTKEFLNDVKVSGALDVTGISTLGSTTGATISAAGLVDINNATTSTTTTSGALQVAGGVGIVENVNIGGDMGVLTGEKTLSGSIKLASGNVTVTTSSVKVTTGSVNQEYGIDTDWMSISSGDITLDYTGRYLVNVNARYVSQSAGTNTFTQMTVKYGGTSVLRIYANLVPINGAQATSAGSFILDHTDTANKITYELIKVDSSAVTIVMAGSSTDSSIMIFTKI